MFENLENGRIWIYASNRKLSKDEQQQIQSKLDTFCESWSAHGDQLSAQFKLFYDQILVLAVDEDAQPASGCSIDNATAMFLQINRQFNLDLINRLNLTFLKGDEVYVVNMSELQEAFSKGAITNETLFLDNTISTLTSFKTQWKKPFENSWAYKKVT